MLVFFQPRLFSKNLLNATHRHTETSTKMATCSNRFQVRCWAQRPSIPKFDQFRSSHLSSFKPSAREMQKAPMKLQVPQTIIKKASMELLDAFTNLVFEFIDQPLLPSQSNFAPVQEMGEAVFLDDIRGSIPDGFPEGVYIRNGPNPLFGGLKSTKSMFGRSSHTWVEGEGMLHAVYLKKESDGRWSILYNNRHVETDTYKLEKQRNRPCFVPAIEGDSPAILLAYLLNLMRFGKINKLLSNTSIFEHSGRFYSIAENHLPQEIDIHTLKTVGNWDVNGYWKRPFTAHPKKAPGSGELVMMGVDAMEPFFEIGIISADGNKLVHKADLKFRRSTLCHDIGVTKRYNVILDFPITVDLNRLVKGGPLIKHDKKGYARIGVMPRYGDADSVLWFEVEPCSVFHIINSFEDGDEVVVWACRASDSIIPGPDLGLNKFEWFSRRFKHPDSFHTEESSANRESYESFFSRAYEWRLNMKTGEVKERYLSGTVLSMDFPMINETYVGLRNKYGYTQVVDLDASSISGMCKYGGLAKLHFEERECQSYTGEKGGADFLQIQYHRFPDNTFCSGAAFVPKQGGLEEDDGWVITFVHNEHSNVSQVHIIDTKKFTSEPVAKITLQSRVPYGFHAAFMPAFSQL